MGVVTAPTARQLKILRLLAAGVQLQKPDHISTTLFSLTLSGTLVGRVQRMTVITFVHAGWVRHDDERGRWVLTEAGRQRALVSHSVVNFAAEVARQSPADPLTLSSTH